MSPATAAAITPLNVPWCNKSDTADAEIQCQRVPQKGERCLRFELKPEQQHAEENDYTGLNNHVILTPRPANFVGEHAAHQCGT